MFICEISIIINIIIIIIIVIIIIMIIIIIIIIVIIIMMMIYQKLRSVWPVQQKGCLCLNPINILLVC